MTGHATKVSKQAHFDNSMFITVRSSWQFATPAGLPPSV